MVPDVPLYVKHGRIPKDHHYFSTASQRHQQSKMYNSSHLVILNRIHTRAEVICNLPSTANARFSRVAHATDHSHHRKHAMLGFQWPEQFRLIDAAARAIHQSYQMHWA